MPDRTGQPATRVGDLPATRVGDLRRLSMTVPQVAQILKIGAKEVRTAIDRQVVVPTLVQHGKRLSRTLDGIDLLCLRVRDVLHHDVRRQIYAGLKQAHDSQRLDEPFNVPGMTTSQGNAKTIFNVIQDMAARTISDTKLLASTPVGVDENGRLNGTDVEAHRVAALVAGGMAAEDIAVDYPNLDAAKIDAAIAYAQLNPKQGRPYPGRTVKSILRHGGGGGLAAAFAAARDDQDDA